MLYRFIIPIFISHHFDFGQSLKKRKKKKSQKELFNEIWLKVGEQEGFT